MESEIKLSPIGQVRVTTDGYCLALKKAYAPALAGLDGFGYLNVLWWANLADGEEVRSLLTCERPYKHGPATMGLFATRSPVRPNPIAHTVVSVLNIDHVNGVVHVPYIDAEENSPILDIKPYHPSVDRVKEVSLPNWCRHWPQWVEDSATFDWAAEFENAR